MLNMNALPYPDKADAVRALHLSTFPTYIYRSIIGPSLPSMDRFDKGRGHWIKRRLSWAKDLIKSLQHGLPFNPHLFAFNVFEMPIPLEPILDARLLYEQTVIAERLLDNRDYTPGCQVFDIKRPYGWGSDICWLSCANDSTYNLFKAIFDRLNVAEQMASLIDHDKVIRVYNSFIVTRSRCSASWLHMDYEFEAETNAYTLMTPLYDYSQSTSGHLVYKSSLGRTRDYTYHLGRAIIFGAGFRHATSILHDTSQRAFLCFTFGSDKRVHWKAIYRTLAGQSRLTWGPDGERIIN
jgi:hypothetical protein